MKVNEKYGMVPSDSLYAKATGFLASLECELEGVRNPQHHGNFRCDTDGSLRNNGYEFITKEGRSRLDLVEEFSDLHKSLTFYDKIDPFSERTSTHVHINVVNNEMQHVRNMVLLYALFEELFFSMVKPVRRDNIHCVPLTETYLPSIYKAPIETLHVKWHKYTALNIKRLSDLGTLEFRHLHGTGNAAEVSVWLHVLENLWKLSQRVVIDEESLSNKQLLQEWFQLLFFPADRIMMLQHSLFDIIRNSLLDVKFSTLKG